MNYTPKQILVLDTIFNYQQVNKCSPTLSEVAKELNVSTVTIYEHVTALEKKMAITRRSSEARSIEIVDKEYLAGKGITMKYSEAIDLLRALKAVPVDQPIPIDLREKLNLVI